MIRQFTLVKHIDGKVFRFAPYDGLGYTQRVKEGLKKGKVVVEEHTIDEHEVEIDPERGYVIRKKSE